MIAPTGSGGCCELLFTLAYLLAPVAMHMAIRRICSIGAIVWVQLVCMVIGVLGGALSGF